MNEIVRSANIKKTSKTVRRGRTTSKGREIVASLKEAIEAERRGTSIALHIRGRKAPRKGGG